VATKELQKATATELKNTVIIALAGNCWAAEKEYRTAGKEIS